MPKPAHRRYGGREGAFVGACALAPPQMEVYQAFEEAVLFVQNQPYQDPNIINSSLISAVRGHFGDCHLTEKTKGSHLWISPLMSLDWLFDVATVAAVNKFLPALRDTETFAQALHQVMRFNPYISKRPPSHVPWQVL